MMKLNLNRLPLLASIVSVFVVIPACTTDDVLPETPDNEENLIEINDIALGQYLVYNCSRTDDERLPARTAIEIDGRYYLNTDKAATVENLYLVKNDTQIKKLSNAGLSTAEQKITDMSVLQYFAELKTLKLTSNEVTKLDITQCPLIETIEMNYNLIASLDLSNATNLKRLRYGSNKETDNSQKLSGIDLSNCNSLEHLYLKNQNIATDAMTLPTDYQNLREMDLSGNPGAPFPLPAQLYNQLTTATGVSIENNDKPGTEDPVPSSNYDIPDTAFGEYLYYLVQQGTLPDGLVTKEESTYKLNTEIACNVTVLNVAKTSKNITTLTEAGLSTASTPIQSADGLQFFTSLKEFTATSNNFTTQLPLSQLTELETLQINTAGISTLDISANTKLRVLNCNGSSKYDKLKQLDLKNNTKLETLNLKNNELETLDLSTLINLKEVDLSGNPGANFPIPADIYKNLTTKKGVKSL